MAGHVVSELATNRMRQLRTTQTQNEGAIPMHHGKGGKGRRKVGSKKRRARQNNKQ
jgi:hypothetical protein